MRVVINDCYGGFSLSTEGIREYLRRTDRKWAERENDLFPGSSLLGPIFEVEGESDWYDRDIPRDDPALVATVEALGSQANGSCAALKIEEISPGTAYRIDEYDGYEAIETRDSLDWSVAR